MHLVLTAEFDQFAVLHPRGTRGHARHATEATIEMLRDGLVGVVGTAE